MSTPCPSSRSGYALLSFVLITISLLILIIIPLYSLSLFNVRSTVTSQSTRINFYVTESAVYDLVAKIINSNYLWPDAANTHYEADITYNGITTHVTTDRDASYNYTIDALTDYKDTTRHLEAQLSPTSSGGTPSDVIIVMDTSGSMNIDSTGEPLDTAINAALELVNELKDNTDLTQIGVVGFNTTATLKQELVDESQFNDVIDVLNNDLTAGGWTNISDGFDVALQELNSSRGRPSANRYVVLLSDGVANRQGHSSLTSCQETPKLHTNCTCAPTNCRTSPNPQSAIGKSNTIKDQGITIFTIGLNLQYYSTDIDPALCDPVTQSACGAREVARQTLWMSASGADHFFDSPDPLKPDPVTGETELDKIYKEIANEIIEAAKFSLTEVR